MSRLKTSNSRSGALSAILILIASAVLYLSPIKWLNPQAASAGMPQAANSIQETKQTGAAFHGKIVDETGAGVTDAVIKIYTVNATGRGRFEAKTNDEGEYKFENVSPTGEYRLTIESQQWVGIVSQDRETVIISDQAPDTRDFTLQRACRIRIRTIDEQGNPIRRVSLMAANLADPGFYAPETVFTDNDGWATLGGLKPADTEYVVATMHDDYGFARLTTLLKDPDKIPTQELTLRSGKEVRGIALCSDGKPASGWKINALPTWWHFGRSPSGETIVKDGSFTLRHIVPGEYNLSISIPMGDNSSSVRPLLSETDLWSKQGPLDIKIDHPSPASLVHISGRVKLTGKSADRGFWIFADSTDTPHHGSVYVNDQQEFRIGPIPPGNYRLTVNGAGLEAETITVKAPADHVELKVSVPDQLRLSGKVVDQQTGEPIQRFRIRIAKVRTLRGPNYGQSSDWHEFANEQGTFSIEVNGPGIYQILVAAKDYAWTMSDQFNTDEDAGKPIDVALSSGVSLNGLVVDESGQPVDNAHVFPQSRIIYSYGQRLEINGDEDAAKSINGRFELAHLLPGPESLKVVHPDFTETIVPTFEIEENHPPLKITMKRGATVRGRVFDERGQPEAHVTLFFDDRSRYGYARDEQGRFATAVTDEQGFYEVHHLPEQLCYVNRSAEQQFQGVARRCLLPVNGRVHELDMGGKTQLYGRLLINGQPYANGRVVLSEDEPHFGIFRTEVRTHADGSFTFCGSQPGDWTLYYAIPGRRNDWGRVQDIRVTSDPQDLGDIELVTGKVQVSLEADLKPEDADGRLRLQEFDPHRLYKDDVGVSSRPEPDGSFLYGHVPPGQFELVYTTSDQRQIRKRIDVSSEHLEPEFQLKIPKGTAALSGQFDEELRERGYYPTLYIWAKDETLLIGLVPNQEDGSYEVRDIPAGDYLIRKGNARNAPPCLQLSIKEGENRIQNFTTENITDQTDQLGVLSVQVFLKEGILTTCRVHLENEQGRIAPNSTQHGRNTFFAAPGPYTLVIDAVDSPIIRRPVELKILDEEARTAKSYQMNVHLE